MRGGGGCRVAGGGGGRDIGRGPPASAFSSAFSSKLKGKVEALLAVPSSSVSPPSPLSFPGSPIGATAAAAFLGHLDVSGHGGSGQQRHHRNLARQEIL